MTKKEAAKYKSHLKKISLAEALFWFIENICLGEPNSGESDLFFYLRERFRAEQGANQTK